MPFYFKSGDTINLGDSNSIEVFDKLPVGNYVLKFDERKEIYYLAAVSNFGISGKLYGDVNKRADRILNTYIDRSVSTGVLLSGIKGSGKTMLMKLISHKAQDKNTPTIIINEAFYGPDFNKFIQDIDQECIIIFDEFEKVYDAAQQEQVLSLLDGVFPTKKLFLLTVNNSYLVNENMINRPGRLFYHFSYKGLNNEFILEYCEDNLKNKDMKSDVLKVSMLFSHFNFDMLKAIVEEMNRYDETAFEVLKYVNASSSFDESAYILDLSRKDKKKVTDIWPKRETARNIYRHTFRLSYRMGKNNEECTLSPKDLKGFNTETKTFTFENEEFILTATKTDTEFDGDTLDLIL